MNAKGTPGNLKPFQKGDKRINRKGKPRDFAALRRLAQGIAHQELLQKDGSFATVAELILTGWASSKEPSLQIKFVEYAWGKVPSQVEGTVNTVSMTLEQWKKQREKNLAQVAQMEADFDEETP